MRLADRAAQLTPSRLFRSRTTWWIALGVVVVVVVAISALALAGGPGAAPKTVASTVSTVRRGTVSMTASAAGTVQASATRGLSFSVSGTVTEIDVQPGNMVTVGQVLAKIDDSDAQTALASAQDALTSAENALTTAEQTPSPTPTQAGGTGGGGTGCAVPAAYVIPAWQTSSPTPTPTSSPSASPSPSPTPTSPSPSPKPTRTGGTGGGGTGGGGTGCKTGSSGGTGSGGGGTGTGGAGANGGAGGGSGRGGGTDPLFSAEQQVNNAQLALTQAQAKLAGTIITAPVAGRVLSVGGTVGTTESPGGTGFIVLGGVSDTEVTASFTETDVAHLAVGQLATITLPDRAGQTFTGKVSEVSPAGTVSGRLVKYPVMLAFDQVPADLLFGQSANVAVTTQSVSDVLYVSSPAVTITPDGTASVTVRANGQDQTRAVQIGLRGDQYTEIKSGLTEGESVVVGGQ